MLADLAPSAGRRVRGFSPGALDAIRRYPWPGNVRELRNAIARRIALGDMVDDAPGLGGPASRPVEGADVMAAILAEDLPLTRARQKVVDEFERRYIERVLAKHGGNVTHAAATSGIARRYFNAIRARLVRG
jgi:DNA-binding NtrC family response regulator